MFTSPPGHHTISSSTNQHHGVVNTECVGPCPGNLDILCGRGRGYFNHPGNRRMLSIVDHFKPAYQAATKAERPTFVQRVVEIIQEWQDGIHPRFLKRRKGSKKHGCEEWYELSEIEVLKKVAHTLREQKEIVKAPKQLRRTIGSKWGKKKVDEDDETGETGIPKEIFLVDPAPLDEATTLSYSKCERGSEGPHARRGRRRSLLRQLEFQDAILHDSNPAPSPSFRATSIVPVCKNEDRNWAKYETRKGRGTVSVRSTLHQQYEPLCLSQPHSPVIFSDKDIDTLLRTVLDEEDFADATLDLVLDGTDLQYSLHSVAV